VTLVNDVRLCPDCSARLFESDGRWYCPHCDKPVPQDAEDLGGDV
jgi:uncharacterized Zn finger protein (UPF0148 family)